MWYKVFNGASVLKAETNSMMEAVLVWDALDAAGFYMMSARPMRKVRTLEDAYDRPITQADLDQWQPE